MIISVTLSKPVKNIEEILGRPYQRIKIRAANNSNSTSYMTELFTQKQAFHEQKSEQELNDFIEKHAGTTFKNCVIRTESEEITILGNKKGEKTRLVKKIDSTPKVQNITWNRKKKLSDSGRKSRTVPCSSWRYDSGRPGYKFKI